MLWHIRNNQPLGRGRRGHLRARDPRRKWGGEHGRKGRRNGGKREVTQHSTRRKHRPLRSMLRHGTQQSTSRPRRPRILGTTAMHRQRNGGHAWKGAQEDGRNETMQQSTRQGTEHGVRDRRLPPRRPVRTTGGYRGDQREQSDNDKEDDDGASRQGGWGRRLHRAVVRRQLEGGMTRSLLN